MFRHLFISLLSDKITRCVPVLPSAYSLTNLLAVIPSHLVLGKYTYVVVCLAARKHYFTVGLAGVTDLGEISSG